MVPPSDGMPDVAPEIGTSAPGSGMGDIGPLSAQLSEHLADDITQRQPLSTSGSASPFGSEQPADHTENLIDDPTLKLDMQETLDHENFSKLLELDSKNDDDLFSSADLLEHDISEDLGKLVPGDSQTAHDARLNQSEDPHVTNGGALDDVHSHGGESHHSDQDSKNHNEQNAQQVQPLLPQSTLAPQSQEHQYQHSGLDQRERIESSIQRQEEHELQSPQTKMHHQQQHGRSHSGSSHSLNDINLDLEPEIPSLQDDSSTITRALYNPDTFHVTPELPDDTTATITESKNGQSAQQGQKDEVSSPSNFQSVSLPPAPLPENAVNKYPPAPPMDVGAQLVMTEFHDPTMDEAEQSKISAYARLDFQSFTFYVQTLQVIIGRRSENDFSHKVDVNLGPSKSISRRHAQIFYNFGTGRFELSIMGKNGAFVDDAFIERGITVQLKNRAKVQIGQIPFQFILPDQEAKEKKAIEPVDAVTMKKTLSNNTKLAEASRSATPTALPLKGTPDPKSEKAKLEPPKKKPTPKKQEKKEPKPPKPPKKVYTLEEIPLEYRSKPTGSYSNLITACLRKYSSAKGMSLSGIYAGIRELFPYYKYCPDGWQSSVRHNLSLNKSFRKVSKEGKGWLWGLNEEYIAEREKQKKKQAEAAAMKAKAAQLKLEQQQQQKAKKVTESSNTVIKSASKIPPSRPKPKQPNISQTLAANRADRKATADGNQRTMKYLQEQLMILTKERHGLDKQVMASILTQALAMTINQVTQAAKSKGITGNPLTALIDKNPQHLNLILAAAVNAATIKVTNGSVKQLVSMPPPTAATHPEDTAMLPNVQNSSQSLQHVTAPFEKVKSSESFDPSSLSKFFQPKQPPRVSTPVSTQSVLPSKRPSSETESSSEDESSSADDSDSEGSDDDSSAHSENEDSGSGKDSSSDDGSSDGE
ncbi:LADA_0C10176g1_1 [Lachancea dasiensis]|uniref:LADA_0C10176g1_1 n=1 Tax=Lachancea dasiensis TaxID=1072105 RepID=A0A1G4J1F4_9SACH|nr:LADA_0C10176g1_1 [Lachancea dasiensis]